MQGDSFELNSQYPIVIVMEMAVEVLERLKNKMYVDGNLQPLMRRQVPYILNMHEYN